MSSKIFLSFSLAVTSVVLSANPLFANSLSVNPLSANPLSANPLSVNPLSANSNSRNLAQAPDSQFAEAQSAEAQSAEAQTPSGENWVDFPEIKAGFMEGCVGSETLAAGQAATKQNYCQCAFEAYAGRYSPQQFLQINTLANRAEADGPLLVNLMMAPELESCSTTTGYQP